MSNKNKSRKVRDEGKYEHAWLLFSQNASNAEIVKKVGIADRTLSRWIKENDWHTRRAASSITRDQLVNKTLSVIDSLLERALEEKNSAKLADQLSKLAGAIRNLDKQSSVVDIVQVFMTFNRWLINQQVIDKELTEDLIKDINRYQDMFINERLSHQR